MLSLLLLLENTDNLFATACTSFSKYLKAGSAFAASSCVREREGREEKERLWEKDVQAVANKLSVFSNSNSKESKAEKQVSILF